MVWYVLPSLIECRCQVNVSCPELPKAMYDIADSSAYFDEAHYIKTLGREFSNSRPASRNLARTIAARLQPDKATPPPAEPHWLDLRAPKAQAGAQFKPLHRLLPLPHPLNYVPSEQALKAVERRVLKAFSLTVRGY